MLKHISGVVKIPSHVHHSTRVLLLPYKWFNMQFECPPCLPIPTSSSSYREYIMLKFWHYIHFHIGTWWCPKHTIISSAQDGAWQAVFIRVFLISSHSPKIKVKGIQKMTAQANYFFINILFSQVYSGTIALLQCRKTLALTSDYSTGLGLSSSPVLGGDAQVVWNCCIHSACHHFSSALSYISSLQPAGEDW